MKNLFLYVLLAIFIHVSASFIYDKYFAAKAV